MNFLASETIFVLCNFTLNLMKKITVADHPDNKEFVGDKIH
jgi:hypothetical protein